MENDIEIKQRNKEWLIGTLLIIIGFTFLAYIYTDGFKITSNNGNSQISSGAYYWGIPKYGYYVISGILVALGIFWRTLNTIIDNIWTKLKKRK